MEAIFTPEAFSAFFQVVMIDLLLAADNTIIVGLAAAGLPLEQRKRVIFIGVILATVLRIIFAIVAVHLLEIVGLLLAGGLLLLWVAWKMGREISRPHIHPSQQVHAPPKTFRQAVFQIVLADAAMSLDNVLGVAGAARDHLWVLVVGLTLSVLLMALASTALANLFQKHRWMVYIGLLIVVFVALHMIWDGGLQVWALGMG